MDSFSPEQSQRDAAAGASGQPKNNHQSLPMASNSGSQLSNWDEEEANLRISNPHNGVPQFDVNNMPATSFHQATPVAGNVSPPHPYPVAFLQSEAQYGNPYYMPQMGAPNGTWNSTPGHGNQTHTRYTDGAPPLYNLPVNNSGTGRGSLMQQRLAQLHAQKPQQQMGMCSATGARTQNLGMTNFGVNPQQPIHGSTTTSFTSSTGQYGIELGYDTNARHTLKSANVFNGQDTQGYSNSTQTQPNSVSGAETDNSLTGATHHTGRRTSPHQSNVQYPPLHGNGYEVQAKNASSADINGSLAVATEQTGQHMAPHYPNTEGPTDVADTQDPPAAGEDGARPEDTGLNNTSQAAFMCRGELLFRCPPGDHTIPQSAQDTMRVVDKLYKAIRNNKGTVEEPDTAEFKNRWGPNATFYTSQDVYAFARELVDTTKKIHLEGWYYRIGDKKRRAEIKSTENWLYAERMERIIEHLTISKSACREGLKSEKILTLIGIPDILLKHSRQNLEMNKRRALIYIRGRKEIDADDQGKAKGPAPKTAKKKATKKSTAQKDVENQDPNAATPQFSQDSGLTQAPLSSDVSNGYLASMDAAQMQPSAVRPVVPVADMAALQHTTAPGTGEQQIAEQYPAQFPEVDLASLPHFSQGSYAPIQYCSADPLTLQSLASNPINQADAFHNPGPVSAQEKARNKRAHDQVDDEEVEDRAVHGGPSRGISGPQRRQYKRARTSAEDRTGASSPASATEGKRRAPKDAAKK